MVDLSIATSMSRTYGAIVKPDPYALARKRITELIQNARDAVERIQPDQRSTEATVFQATWTISLAAGFLEAFALLEPSAAEDLIAEFAAVAGLVGRLRATEGTPELAPEMARVERRPNSGWAGLTRRVNVRRVLPDRRLRARRQIEDRRAASG